MAKAKISWAIRHYSKKFGTDDFQLFMTTHYETREELRKVWREQKRYMNDGTFFKCTRHRVTEWELIGKIEYRPTR